MFEYQTQTLSSSNQGRMIEKASNQAHHGHLRPFCKVDAIPIRTLVGAMPVISLSKRTKAGAAINFQGNTRNSVTRNTAPKPKGTSIGITIVLNAVKDEKYTSYPKPTSCSSFPCYQGPKNPVMRRMITIKRP